MAINPKKPLIATPPDIVLARPVRFIGLSADGVNAIIEVEVIPGFWQATSVDKVTGVGSVVDENNVAMPITVRNGQNVTVHFSWQANNLVGSTNNNTNVVASVTFPVVVDP